MVAKKNWLTSPLVGGIIGVFAGGMTVMLVESAGHAVFGTADPADLSTVTVPMFASVLVAWVVGSGVGATVATIWSRGKSITPGIIVGLILLAGSASNMIAFPHPWWMVLGAVLLMPGAAYLAARWRVSAVQV